VQKEVKENGKKEAHRSATEGKEIKYALRKLEKER
jgi:hypothetical protein